MTLKLKALGLGILATLAMGTFAATNADATTSGHFTSDTTRAVTTLTGSESMSDFSLKIEFSAPGLLGSPIYCTNATFHGTLTATTTQSAAITPTYTECATTVSNDSVEVDFGGCQYVFTSRTSGDATAGLDCPTGEKVLIGEDSATGCTLEFGDQHIANAVTYGTITENKKHAITVNATATGIAYTAHGGLCIFLSTERNDGVMEGGATVHGADLSGSLVNITAT